MPAPHDMPGYEEEMFPVARTEIGRSGLRHLL